MTIWLVRAGSQGEQEAGALRYNVATIGWNNIPSMSDVHSKEQLMQMYKNSHPNATKRHTVNVVGQIWNFANQIKIGDVVVLPLKSRRVMVLGEVQGRYEYRELAPTIRHIIPVKWLKIVPRRQLDQDLLYSLGSLMTVCRIERNDAEDKIKHLIENVDDDKAVIEGLKSILEEPKPIDDMNDKQQLSNIIKEFKIW
jgi:restriction system protein